MTEIKSIPFLYIPCTNYQSGLERFLCAFFFFCFSFSACRRLLMDGRVVQVVRSGYHRKWAIGRTLAATANPLTGGAHGQGRRWDVHV